MARKSKLVVLIIALFACATVFVYRDLIFSSAPAYVGHEGKNLKDPELYDHEGRPLRLSKLLQERGNSTRAVLAMWATWCDPCVRELPVIQKMIPVYRKAGLEIVLINYDGPLPEKSIPEVNAWLITQKLDLQTNYDFGETLLKEYNIAGLPFAIGLGEERRIAWMRLGEIDWANTDKVLAQFK